MRIITHFAVMRLPHPTWSQLCEHHDNVPELSEYPPPATLQSERITMTKVAGLCHSNVTAFQRYMKTTITTIAELCKFHTHSLTPRVILHSHHHRCVNVTINTADCLKTMPTTTELLKTMTKVAELCDDHHHHTVM